MTAVHDVEERVRDAARRGAGRRIALMVLSGDRAEARVRLEAIAPDATVDEIEKCAFEPRNAPGAVLRMRAAGYDEVALFCLSSRWQRRRAPLLMLAAAAGARRVVLLDAEGASQEFTRTRILLREAPRTAAEIVLLPALVAADWLLSSFLLALWTLRPPRQRLRASEGAPLSWLYLRQTPASGALEGGASTHLRGLLEGLAELGHRVHVLANDRLPSARPSAARTVDVTPPDVWFNISVLANERWANLVWLWRAWRAIGHVRPDAIYHRNARSAWASVAAAWLRGVPVVLEYNVPEALAGTYWNNIRRLAGVRRAEGLSLRGATAVGAVSRELAEMTVAAGARRDRVFENPNGVDVERFGTPEAEAAGAALRARLGIADRVVVGFVGTFMPFHGTDVLIETIGRLAEDPRVHFLLVGHGAARASTEQRLAEHVRAGRVAFTGRVAFETLPEYLAAVDVCIAPYIPIPPGTPFINSPVKLFEYMAARKAVVASRLGQIARIVEDGQSGLLVEAGDAAAVAAAIARLVDDPELRRRLGEAARATVAAHYTWRANAARAAEAVGRS
jgi:glycosyltransferase involved in cell wall biosynthesis